MTGHTEDVEALRAMLVNTRWESVLGEPLVASMPPGEQAVVRAEVKAEAKWYAETILASDWLAEHDADLYDALRDELAYAIRTRDEWEANAGEAEARAEAAEAEQRDLVSRLGFGDGVTEPMADNDTIVEFVDQVLMEASEHRECPVICEPCGERLAATICEHCHGSGGNNALIAATLAYSECEWCAGVGKVHEGCAERSYADLRDLLAEVERERDRAQRHIARWLEEHAPEPDGHAGTLTGDLAVDMAAYASRLKGYAEAAEAETARLRHDIESLLSGQTVGWIERDGDTAWSGEPECLCGGDGVRYTLGADAECPVHGFPEAGEGRG